MAGDLIAGLLSPVVAWNREQLRRVIQEEHFADNRRAALEAELRAEREENEKLRSQLSVQKGHLSRLKNEVFKRILEKRRRGK
jgi:hypothetical protein